MWHLLASISAWERVNRSSQCLLSCYSVLWYTIIFPLLIIPLISWARLFSFSSHESFPWTQPVDNKPPSYHVKHPSRLTQSHQCQVKSTSSTYLNICTAGLCVSHMVSPDGQSFLSCIYLSSIITTDPLPGIKLHFKCNEGPAPPPAEREKSLWLYTEIFQKWYT